MVTRELETWGVVRRVRAPADAVWRFEAETELMRMVRRVFEERETTLVSRVRADLEEAERLAKLDRDASPEALTRIKRMRQLAGLIEKALRVFLQTAKLDVGGAASVLDPPKK
jgi:DNA-binding transcriptional regulator GbsR (MarR family)